MTDEETRFYLREMHPYWTKPNVSAAKVQELEASELVEILDAEVRLTRKGQRLKADSRPQRPGSSVQSIPAPVKRRRFRLRQAPSGNRRRLT